jgi:hypothetical protein
MALRDRILNFQQVATATPATPATLAIPNAKKIRTVATVATVALAREEKTEKHATEPTTEKVDWLKPCSICSGHLSTETDRGRTFMVAHSWISHHHLKLKQAGWTAPELYRRNRSKGIIWLELWDDKAATPSLGDNGEIIFTIIRHDRKIVQTAWPKKKIPP